MRRLTLVRHAKSSWKDPSLGDFDRPLNRRGKENAPEMGGRLADRGIEPDALITSPAKRARTTARKIARELDYPTDSILEEPEVYEATLGDLLQIVRGFDDAWDHVMLVGHNPGFTELANFFGADRIDNVPTCGVVCLDFDAEAWNEVDGGGGNLVFFDYPKRETHQD